MAVGIRERQSSDCRYSQRQSGDWRSRGIARGLLAEADGQSGKPALEAIELAKQGRSDIAEHVMWIVPVGDVNGIDPKTNLSNLSRRTFPKWDSDGKVPINFDIQRVINREAEAIGRAYVVLQNIHI
jgi:hypothetical protein